MPRDRSSDSVKGDRSSSDGVAPLAASDVEPERDYQLVRGFVRGDAGSRVAFTARLQALPRMVSCLNRRAGRPLASEEAADLAQDAALIALRKVPEFRRGILLDAWLYRIANYEICNHLRRRRRSQQLSTEFIEEQHAAESSPDVVGFERRESVLEALAMLHKQHAIAIRLHHFEGLNFARLGERLGITENAAKGRYYRGLAELTALLQRRGAGASE
ncbi:MAG: RNA polymerase sigma factor [Planctomycetota bacterium]